MRVLMLLSAHGVRFPIPAVRCKMIAELVGLVIETLFDTILIYLSQISALQ